MPQFPGVFSCQRESLKSARTSDLLFLCVENLFEGLHDGSGGGCGGGSDSIRRGR